MPAREFARPTDSVLHSFIAPGQPAQVLAGCLITFAFFVYFLNSQPYNERAFNKIGNATFLIVFLYLFLALIIKVDIRVSSRDSYQETFVAVCAGLLTLAVGAIPLILVVNRLRWPLVEEEEEDLEDEKEERAESDTDAAEEEAELEARIDAEVEAAIAEERRREAAETALSV